MMSSLILNHASQPSSVNAAPQSAALQSKNWSPNDEQSALQLVMSAKKSLLLGLTQNSKYCRGQLSEEAMNISTTSSCQRGSLQLLQLAMISLSMLCHCTQRYSLSWHSEAAVVSSGVPLIQVNERRAESVPQEGTLIETLIRQIRAKGIKCFINLLCLLCYQQK